MNKYLDIPDVRILEVEKSKILAYYFFLIVVCHTIVL